MRMVNRKPGKQNGQSNKQLTAIEASRVIAEHNFPLRQTIDTNKVYETDSIKDQLKELDLFDHKIAICTILAGEATNGFTVSRDILNSISYFITNHTISNGFDLALHDFSKGLYVSGMYLFFSMNMKLNPFEEILDQQYVRSAYKALRNTTGFLMYEEDVPEAIDRVVGEILEGLNEGKYDSDLSVKMEAITFISNAHYAGYLEKQLGVFGGSDFVDSPNPNLAFHKQMALWSAELFDELDIPFDQLDQEYYSGLIRVYLTLESDLVPKMHNGQVYEFLNIEYAEIKERVFPGCSEHLHRLEPFKVDDGLIIGPTKAYQILIDKAREVLGLDPIKREKMSKSAKRRERANGGPRDTHSSISLVKPTDLDLSITTTAESAGLPSAISLDL